MSLRCDDRVSATLVAWARGDEAWTTVVARVRLRFAPGADATLLPPREGPFTNANAVELTLSGRPPAQPARVAVMRGQHVLVDRALERGRELGVDLLQSLPAEQRPASFAPGDRIYLEGLVAGAPRVDVFLPAIQPVAQASCAGRGVWDLPLALHGLHVDVEEREVSLIFRGSVRIGDAAAPSVRAPWSFAVALAGAPAVLAAVPPAVAIAAPDVEAYEDRDDDDDVDPNEPRIDFLALSGPPTEDEIVGVLRHARRSEKEIERILVVWRRDFG